jgi:hypothetical protein
LARSWRRVGAKLRGIARQAPAILDFAPRIGPELLTALVRLDDRRRPIAETSRRLGAEADRLGLPRPSYQRVRVLVHESRRLRRGPSTTAVLVDVMMRARPPEAVLEHVSGVGVPSLDR